jgi:hypothetical protein
VRTGTTGKEVSNMASGLKKAVLVAALATLSPIAALLPGATSEAQAHTYVSGSVVLGSPVAVLGFSYGNPYVMGPVYDDPYACDVGPLYYYPAYRVYAPYYPSFRYTYYSRPVYYHRGGYYGGGYHGYYGRHQSHGSGHGYGYGPGRSIRGHGRYGNRGH